MESQCFLLRITMIRWQLAQPTTSARTFASSFIVRAVQEECTLIRELPGYSDYAARVSYRLIPRIW
jgi:protein-S-isoprenylcysteine O-methyltransferase Ste14